MSQESHKRIEPIYNFRPSRSGGKCYPLVFKNLLLLWEYSYKIQGHRGLGNKKPTVNPWSHLTVTHVVDRSGG